MQTKRTTAAVQESDYSAMLFIVFYSAENIVQGTFKKILTPCETFDFGHKLHHRRLETAKANGKQPYPVFVTSTSTDERLVVRNMVQEKGLF